MALGESRLYELAQGQAGHFSAAQAQAAGVSRELLYYFKRTGTVCRAARSVYRLTRFPPQPFEDLVVACLWAGPGAVVSHQSALVVHGLGDTAVGEIHLTLPRPFRGRRTGVVIHRVGESFGRDHRRSPRSLRSRVPR